MALFALGGSWEAVGTEDIAIEVAALSPGMFAWQKYPDRVDKELVRVALSDARLKKGWVVGSHDKGGWTLTSAGQDLAVRNPRQIASESTPRQRGRTELQVQRDRGRLLTSDTYQRAASGALGEITGDEADAFFRINVYVEGPARERKIARIENQFGDDPELGPIVRALAVKARERN